MRKNQSYIVNTKLIALHKTHIKVYNNKLMFPRQVFCIFLGKLRWNPIIFLFFGLARWLVHSIYRFLGLMMTPLLFNYTQNQGKLIISQLIERNEKLSQFFSNYQKKGKTKSKKKKTFGILQSSLKNTSLQSFEFEKLCSLSFLLRKGCLTKYSNYMSK